MFGLTRWLKDMPKRRRMQKFVCEHRFNLHDEYGFCVNGLVVSEFGYLIRYVTDGKHDSFEDLEVIADDFVFINGAIISEMNRPVLREEEVNFTTHQGAIQNLKNLQYIVNSIAKYVDLAKALGRLPNDF